MAHLAVHVVIASIPEREANLHALIADVQAQTRPPEVIACYLNGYDHAPAFAPNILIYQSAARRAAGSRWAYVEQPHLSPDTVICVIDDDFRLAPTYLAQTLDALKANVGMVAWTGHTRLSRYYGLETSRTTLGLIIGGVGASALRVSSVRGITSHRHAEELLRMGGDDELLVSMMLRERGETIIRPAGTPPIRSVDALQYASTASHKQHGERWQRRRRELAQEYGWR